MLFPKENNGETGDIDKGLFMSYVTQFWGNSDPPPRPV